MRITTKISFGFAAICIIFLLVSAAIVFEIKNVSNNTHTLSNVVTPASDNSSELSYGLTMQALYTADFSDNNNLESWESAETYHTIVMKTIEILRNDLILIAEHGEQYNLRNLFKSLEDEYINFNKIAQTLPSLLKEIEDDRLNLRDQITNFQNLGTQFREKKTDERARAILNGLTGGDLNKINALLQKASTMQINASDINAGVLRGLLYRNISYFEAAEKSSAQSQEAARSLLDESSSEYDRNIFTQLVDATQNCMNALVKIKTDFTKKIETVAELNNLRGSILNKGDQISEVLTKINGEFTTNTVNAVSTVMTTLVIGLTAALLVSITLGLIIRRGVSSSLEHIIETLTDGATEVDATSSKLSIAATSLAEGATENAASLEETSAALEELSSMTKNNSDNALEANSLMSQTTEAVGLASNSMTNVIQAMDEIATSGNEISKIIKAIDEIAFQTNLLALNAAVEAARAGEAGAGFAVVADEVRNLAIRCADAAKNTSDLIASTINSIDSGSQMVNATADNFHIVSDHSTKVAQLVSEVAEASKEQTQGISQISTAMTQMDKVTQTNANSAEQSAGAANQLYKQSEKLMNILDEMSIMVHGQSNSHIVRNTDHSNKKPDYSSLSLPVAVSRSNSSKNALPPAEDDFLDF